MPGPYDCDRLCAVPWPLRLRTIHAALLAAALVSLAAALEWPAAWRVIAVGDLALASLLFGLAATREWFLMRFGRRYVRPALADDGLPSTSPRTVTAWKAILH